MGPPTGGIVANKPKDGFKLCGYVLPGASISFRHWGQKHFSLTKYPWNEKPQYGQSTFGASALAFDMRSLLMLSRFSTISSILNNHRARATKMIIEMATTVIANKNIIVLPHVKMFRSYDGAYVISDF